MNESGRVATPDDDPLGLVVESFLERFRRGERPALTALVERHPELAVQIRELIPALVELEQLAGSTGSVIPSSRHLAGMDASGDENPSPARLGDYVLIRRIGGGGMGVVYEAEHESLKNRVALKVVHPRFRADAKYLRRFHAEARLAAGLHHTNIVSVFDYGEQHGVCYYAMQFIEGQPLDRVLSDIRRLRDDDTESGSLAGLDAIVTMPAGAALQSLSAAASGLLTGRFAAATEPVLANTATGVAAPAPAVLATGDWESSSDQALRPGDETPEGQRTDPAEPAPEQPGQPEPSTLGSSSFGGSGELRYYREIARVGAQVADALEYAHRRGVLHRDIKPSNLLLDAMGNVWVTDFGLAKLEESVDPTQSRELVGTLRYMAPERFRGTSDRRGDIYSLGATLYELLALKPPFDETDQIRLIERIRNDAPKPPRQLAGNIPRDLETIVLKALAKEMSHRFGSAGAMADELRRFVEGRPIRSRPVSSAERFWRWCKRDPWLAGANVAAALLTIVLTVVSMTAAVVYRNQASALRAERGRSDEAVLDARWRAVDAYMAQARAGRFSRRPGQRFETLEAVNEAVKLLDGLPSEPDSASRRESLRDLAIAALALPDLQPVGRVIERPAGVISIAFDPTMTRYALRFRDGTILVRRVADDQEVARFQARGDHHIPVFAFSPDGRYLTAINQPGGSLTVWDIQRREVCLNDLGPVVSDAARFSPDSHRLAVVNESHELIMYDLTARRQCGRWTVPGLASLAFRPDGAEIAFINNESKPPTCRILDGITGRLVREFSLRARSNKVAWSPDGITIAAPRDDQKIDLWDAATGSLRATLEGHTTDGISAAFHPAGALLASQDWSGRLRIWDAALGRPLLDLTAGAPPNFSQDGRIVVDREDRLITYQVDPALEYRTFAHVFFEPIGYARASVRHDGRVLAVGTAWARVLWDLARGSELAFLPIGNVWHLMFEASGDLITSGLMGVHRWPIQLDARRGTFAMGPPRPLRLPEGLCGIAEDRSGQIVAKADHDDAQVLTPERTIRVGPLNDCRSVAVSPDGQWLATGTHISSHGAQVWHIPDCTKVELPLDYGTPVEFSPDGKWLMTMSPPCRLWEVGTWREVRQIGDVGCCFSPDGRLLVVQNAAKVIRLVETETGKTLARFESPDSCAATFVTFSPDGSRLVVATDSGPAVHVWDLRTIRKHLAGMGLDWDAPAYSDLDPASPSSPPLPQLRVEYGLLADHLEDSSTPRAALLERYTARIARDSDDAEAYHHRAHALFNLMRNAEAIDDMTRAIHLRPGDAHYRVVRATSYINRKQLDSAIADMEAALALKVRPTCAAPEWLASYCRTRVWELVSGPEPQRDYERAMALARRAVELVPDNAMYLNALGVALYRTGQFEKAIATLERSLTAGHIRIDGMDLFFLAMAHHRLGHRAEARAAFDSAVRWLRGASRGINGAQYAQGSSPASAPRPSLCSPARLASCRRTFSPTATKACDYPG